MNTKSCRPKKGSTSQNAQNVGKSLIGEAWMKCCSITPTTSIAQIYSILALKRSIKTLSPGKLTQARPEASRLGNCQMVLTVKAQSLDLAQLATYSRMSVRSLFNASNVVATKRAKLWPSGSAFCNANAISIRVLIPSSSSRPRASVLNASICRTEKCRLTNARVVPIHRLVRL
jgi:hypothetical protein